MRFDLTDEECALLDPLMPERRKGASVDDRKIINAIFYVLCTGMPWRALWPLQAYNDSTAGPAAASGSRYLIR
jgi:transposase